jgi:hypothetical protein
VTLLRECWRLEEEEEEVKALEPTLPEAVAVLVVTTTLGSRSNQA